MSIIHLDLPEYRNLPNFPMVRLLPNGAAVDEAPLRHACGGGIAGVIILPIEHKTAFVPGGLAARPLGAPICTRCGRRPTRAIHNFLFKVVLSGGKTALPLTLIEQGFHKSVRYLSPERGETWSGPNKNYHCAYKFVCYKS